MYDGERSTESSVEGDCTKCVDEKEVEAQTIIG